MLLKSFPMEDKDLAISPRWYVSLGDSNPRSQVISNNCIGLVFHQKDPASAQERLTHWTLIQYKDDILPV